MRVAVRPDTRVLGLLDRSRRANVSAAAALSFLIPPVSDQKAALNHASSLTFRGKLVSLKQSRAYIHAETPNTLI